MKQQSLVQHIGVAMLLTIIAILTGFIFHKVMGWNTAVKLVMVAVTLVYLGYLIYQSRVRAGKLTLIIICLMMSLSCFFLVERSGLMLVIAAVMIWVVRSLLNYSSIVAVITDMGLCTFSLAGADWAFSASGSIVAAIWSFYLIQSLHCLIPQQFGETKQVMADEQSVDYFDHAYQLAEQAIRQMAKGER